MRKRERGYSLPELLTVVAIVGLVALVSIPAIFQLTPQYRVRSVTGEIAAVLRMARQNALSTRRAWRVTFNTTGRRYALHMVRDPTAALSSSTNWVPIGSNNRPTSAGNVWRTIGTMTVTSSGFNDVDGGSSGIDIIFKHDGQLDTSCYSTANPNVRLHVNNNLVRYNTYYLRVLPSGFVSTDQTKE